MKTLLLTLLGIFISVSSFAQKDSIAVSQIKQMGVYFFEGDDLKQISPIVPEGTKSSPGLFKATASLEYLGENSENILGNKPEFYIFIPSMYLNKISVKQFRLVSLSAKKGKRKLKAIYATLFGSRTGAKSETMDMKKLSDECYKIFSSEPMEEGHYGIFYNYGSGIPSKLYDFDIVNK